MARLKSFNPFYTQFACRNVDNLLTLSSYNVTAKYNVTIAPNMPDASKLDCISTPWVRLFSRYTMPDLSSREITQWLRCLCTSFDFLVVANDGDLLVGDHHELPFPAGPLRPEISHGYLRSSLLRVERLGIPIQHIPSTLHVLCILLEETCSVLNLKFSEWINRWKHRLIYSIYKIARWCQRTKSKMYPVSFRRAKRGILIWNQD